MNTDNQKPTARRGAEPPSGKPPIGCHVSIAGGVSRAVERARERECECIQIFTTSPRAWRHQEHSPEEVAAFRRGVAGAGLAPVAVHAIYLLNLATADGALWKRSVENLSSACRWAGELGASTVILHAGHCPAGEMETGLERVARGLREVLAAAPAGLTVSLEMTAGGETSVGGRPEHFAAVLEHLDGNPRIRVWLDTAHAWGAGWDLRGREGVDRLLAELGEAVGMERIAGIHANDTAVELGSKKDRHENIGEGAIGAAGFRGLLNHPALRHLPFILETPGFDQQGPDLRNVQALRQLRQ